jgi:hypothetical protein
MEMAMSKTGRTLLGLALAASFTTLACSDAPSGPSTAPDLSRISANEDQKLLGGLLGLLISPVKRTSPLANDVTWSFWAGPNGGFTTNSSVGLTVTVPPGALENNVKITVTALQGAPVAYRFEPHLEFSKKVLITQNLKGTSSGLLSSLLYKGGHFPGDTPQYTSSGKAIVDEVVPAILSNLLGLLTRTATFGVEHFTGWILASGNESAM